MSIVDIFKKIGNKKPQVPETSPLLEQIKSQMDLMVQRSVALPEAYADQKAKIQKIFDTVKVWKLQQEIASAKYEQDILGRLTAASRAMDTVLAGKENPEFITALDALEHQVGQRENLEK